MTIIPLIQPNPPKLSRLQTELSHIEASGIYSNNGPLVRQLERQMTDTLFGGSGAVVTTANATLGLMLAMKLATDRLPKRRRLALMPSFTFAATAQAALWAGLRPLLCDIEPQRWSASAEAEEKLLRRYGDRVGVIVPYATFGTALDLDRYAALGRKYDVQIVVDAASSLGTTMPDGRNFGAGSACTLVYSMHATKTFACGEGGLVYTADPERAATLRCMANFGFDGGRASMLPGLNAKLSEVGALLALTKLEEIDTVVARRAALAELYRSELDGFGLQGSFEGQQALQFMPVLLPARLAAERTAIIARMAALGVTAGSYFSPHLAEQPYFASCTLAGDLATTETIANRVMALPLFDVMSAEDVLQVTAALRSACGMTARTWPADAVPPAPWLGTNQTGLCA